MSTRGRLAPVACLGLVLHAGCVGPPLAKRELDRFAERRDAILARQVASPYPRSGAWHYIDFALAALYRNERLDEANAALLKLHKEFPVDPDPRRGPKGEEVADGHWQINLLHRIWWLFNAGSRFFPGCLSPEAEAALLDSLWQ